jgi:hypothetical protein
VLFRSTGCLAQIPRISHSRPQSATVGRSGQIYWIYPRQFPCYSGHDLSGLSWPILDRSVLIWTRVYPGGSRLDRADPSARVKTANRPRNHSHAQVKNRRPRDRYAHIIPLISVFLHDANAAFLPADYFGVRIKKVPPGLHTKV